MAIGRTHLNLILTLLLLGSLHAKDPLGDLIKNYITERKVSSSDKDALRNATLKTVTDHTEPAGISKNERQRFEELFLHIVSRSLYERKKAVSQKVLINHEKVYMGSGTFSVYGTSFGKPGNKGESAVFKDGTPVRTGIITAALPDNSAIGRTIMVRRPLGNNRYTAWIKMPVKDLGPWFRDDPYWVTQSAPRAVGYFKNKQKRWDGRTVLNPAGIDLTPWAWQKLGIPKEQSWNYSGYVEWKFSH